MKLTDKAKASITKGTILKLAIALSYTENWIKELLGANKENGPLTTAKALQVISEETGLDQSEILEEVVTQM